MIEDNSMSNFDHLIPDGMAGRLKSRPNEKIGSHPGLSHYGEVWFDGEQFCEDVWVYGKLAGTVKADTLEKLKESVNDEYGED